MVLFAWFCLGILYSIAPRASSLDFAGDYRVLLLIPVLASLFIDRRMIGGILAVFLAASLVAALIAYFARFGLSTPVDTETLRLAGSHRSGMLAFAVFTALHLALDDRRRRPFWLAFAAVVSGAVFFAFAGRVAYLTQVILLLVFVVQRYRFKALLVAIPALLVLGALLYFSSDILRKRIDLMVASATKYQTVWTTRKTGSNINYTSTGIRIDMARIGAQILMERPLTGWGTGGVAPAYRDYAERHKILTPPASNVHNDYLMFAIQLGIPVLAALFGFFASLWAYTRHVPRLAGLMLSSLCIWYAFNALFGNVMADHATSHFVCIFAGLLTTPALGGPNETPDAHS